MATVIDFTKRCTDRSQLNDLVDVMLDLALADIKAEGIDVAVYETYRSQERQNYLYCQGRSVDECTKKGISGTFARKYSNLAAHQCTWTLNSKHKERRAVDVVPYINGKLTWSNTAKEQRKIVVIMSKYGFECGANWNENIDSCHYQVDGSFTTVLNSKNTPIQTVMAIQTALNKVLGIKLKVDGDWGGKTTDAINKFREVMGYRDAKTGSLGVTALRDLLSHL